mmetsp:Transcript_24466/g.57402  ORF Transcript_24466/g.57402 Transcript_24466/m.57402 type:complete len:200 (-) Transcript_24466:260-859(-)
MRWATTTKIALGSRSRRHGIDAMGQCAGGERKKTMLLLIEKERVSRHEMKRQDGLFVGPPGLLGLVIVGGLLQPSSAFASSNSSASSSSSAHGDFHHLIVFVHPNNDAIGMKPPFCANSVLVLVLKLNVNVAGDLGLNVLGAFASLHPQAFVPGTRRVLGLISHVTSAQRSMKDHGNAANHKEYKECPRSHGHSLRQVG